MQKLWLLFETYYTQLLIQSVSSYDHEPLPIDSMIPVIFHLTSGISSARVTMSQVWTFFIDLGFDISVEVWSMRRVWIGCFWVAVLALMASAAMATDGGGITVPPGSGFMQAGYAPGSAPTPAAEPARDRARDRDPGTPPRSDTSAPPSSGDSGASSAGDAGGGGFSVSGGTGLTGSNGSNGASPELNLSSLKRESVVVSRMALPVPIADDFELRLIFDYQRIRLGKDFSNDNFQLAPFANQLSAKMRMNYYIGSVDALFTVGRMGNGKVQVGPRFQWFTYHDQLRVDDLTLGTGSAQERKYAMQGLGASGRVCLGTYASEYARLRPSFSMAWTTGKGNGMKYTSWEMYAEVHVAGGNPDPYGASGAMAMMPGVLFQVGYVWYNINETKEFQATTVVPAAGLYTDAAQYGLKLPVVNVVLSF